MHDGRRIEEEVERYDQVMRSFYDTQNLDNPVWSRHSIERVRGPESLRGRDRLRQALHSFGFQLL